ncbi:Protein STICHEL [Raphanus sativus]|nr:Protein STICHEL [Raphanus sativus]
MCTTIYIHRRHRHITCEVYLQDSISHHWGDELNNDVKILRIGENGELQENLTGRRGEHCPLYDSKFGHNKDNLGGYESGTTGRVGCNMLLCWNTHKTQRSSKVCPNLVKTLPS